METKDLILRNWKESDASDLYEMCLDKELLQSGIHGFSSVSDSHNAIINWTKENGFKAIINKKDNYGKLWIYRTEFISNCGMGTVTQ